jgi:hypothetical protein
MAGSGIRVFAAGEILTAAQVNGYLMDQTVTRFADAETRDGAFGGLGQPVLTEGRICYLDDVNLIQFFNGSSWIDSSQFTVGDGSITNVKLAPNSVTSDKIAPGTVIAADISPGTITATELAIGAVTSDKILNGTIMDIDVSDSASIGYSKLNLGTSIVNADISASASIGYSKLNLGTSIVNADISASASIVDTKLATIATAGKVSNSATTASASASINTIVLRDGTGTGNFAAGTITADLTGNVTGNLTGTASNASKISNHTVYVQQAQPSGTPVTGDIWFQVTGIAPLT